jgi:hypothetical protein
LEYRAKRNPRIVQHRSRPEADPLLNPPHAEGDWLLVLHLLSSPKAAAQMRRPEGGRRNSPECNLPRGRTGYESLPHDLGSLSDSQFIE